MRFLKWWACGVALLLVAASPVLAGEEEPAPKPKPVLRGEHAIMARECNLSDEQVAKVAEKVDAKRAALADWNKANGVKLAELKASLVTAEDKAPIEAQIKALEDQRAEVEKKADADILAVLTPEQKVTWDGYKMCQDMVAKHKLRGENVAKCRALCNTAAADIGALKGTDEEVAKAKTGILEKLEKSVAELAKPPAEEKPPAEKPIEMLE